MQTTKNTTCPRCGGGIPNDLYRGQYPGALSRADNKTEICSDCGICEALEQIATGALDARWLDLHNQGRLPYLPKEGN